MHAIGHRGCACTAIDGCSFYIFYGVALCVSLIALFKKSRLLVYKLKKRRSRLMRTAIGDIEERLDIHKQHMTKAIIYLLTACCEVRCRSQLA
jgi:hypothetical protein